MISEPLLTEGLEELTTEDSEVLLTEGADNPFLNDYGLKITLPGYSVWDATENQTVFSSNHNIYKTILGKSGYATTADNYTATTIAHGQPVVPAFLVFKKLNAATNRFTRRGGTFNWNPFNIQEGYSQYIDTTNLVTYGYKSAYFTFLERRA